MISNQQKIIFEPLSEKKGYCVYYGIPKHSLSIRIKTVMFVMKDDEIVFLPNNKRSQFHMKRECDEWIEEQIMKKYQGKE